MKFLKILLKWLLMPFILLLGSVLALLTRFCSYPAHTLPRLVWGATPIINYSYWSKAMRRAGYESTTFTDGFYSAINNRKDWDILIQEKYGQRTPLFIKRIFAFFESIFKYDIFFLSFDGFFLGLTSYWWMESFLLKLAGKKTVLMPYGSDSYVYRRIRSLDTIHALLLSYPVAAKKQAIIEKRVDYWTDRADVLCPGVMGPDGFGRWDILVPSFINIDLLQWQASQKQNFFDGHTGTVFIAHAPNHRGFKGTEFVIEAINQLRAEGLKVELILLEKKPNEEVRKILSEVDILVEQLLATGYALNAIEGMASGVPVISNLEDNSLLRPFRRWSYLSECPIVSASPETITSVLRDLVTRPKLRYQLGKAGREYVEKYHGLDSAQHMFGAVIDHLYGRMDAHTLLNLYNPRTSEYCKRKAKVNHPLVDNRIID